MIGLFILKMKRFRKTSKPSEFDFAASVSKHNLLKNMLKKQKTNLPIN